MSHFGNLERENLEAHVELCQERYNQINHRLVNIENKVDNIHNDVLQGNKAMMKVFIGAAVTIIVSFMSTIIVLMEKV